MRRAILVLTVMAATLAVASGVALAVTVLGTEGPDDLAGGAGDDSILGLGGNDVMDGGSGNDFMEGDSGNDFVYGDVGSDRITGATGDDILADGETAGGAYDVLKGEAGKDVLAPINEPAGQDLTMCGAGTDIAYVDEADLVVGCERVLLRPPTCAEEKKIQADRGLLGRLPLVFCA
jgi:Ca2+-binding RTX toxin-like protein